MVSAKEFISYLTKLGFGPFLGVPCSFLTPLINYVIDKRDLDYLAVNNEGEAIAIAAGTYLAGKKPVVMFQNSGLGNAVNPIASLIQVFRIPVLLIVTWRGEPGLLDEPQHELMGKVTIEMLRVLDIKVDYFPETDDQIASKINKANDYMARTNRPFAFVMRKGSVNPYYLSANRNQVLVKRGVVLNRYQSKPGHLARRDVIAALVVSIGDKALFVCTTGKTGRELFNYADRPNHFYMVGSMGCATSLGLGVAIYQKNKPIVIIDGDGAALMRLEAMVSVGHYRPGNLIHILLDNKVHDSTGGQRTLSTSVRFHEIAVACGYRTAISIDRADELDTAVTRAFMEKGPHLIHVKIKPGSDPKLGRPTLTPQEVAIRFRQAVNEPAEMFEKISINYNQTIKEV